MPNISASHRENAAYLAHIANMLYCESIGDYTQVPWNQASPHLRDSVLNGVQRVLEGQTPKQLHESWCQYKTAEGWVRGDVKNEAAKTHPNLVPYDELPAQQRVKDTLFRDVVIAYLLAVGVL